MYYSATEIADFVQGYYKEGFATNYGAYSDYGYKDGDILTFPFVKSTEVLYYNKDALKDALVNYEAVLRKLYAPLGYVLMGSWNEWNNQDYHYILVKEAKGIYSWTLNNVKAGDKGQITKANQNDSDKGYNEIISGADLVTNQSGNCFGFIEAGNYKITYNETEKSISIQKIE